MTIERRARTALALIAAAAGACRAPLPALPGGAAVSRLADGVATGEVTAHSAVVWGRCTGSGRLSVDLAGAEPGAVRVEDEGIGTLRLDGLQPGRRYRYRAGCGGAGEPLSASFRTAPAADAPAAVRFAFGGDLGGQNVCRDRERGYPIFAAIAALRPDFFVGLGDLIYADDQCGARGRYGANPQVPGPPPATDLDGFRAHWRYNRADAGFRRLLAETAYYAVWDDHEIQDDSGPAHDRTLRAPGRRLLPIALRAFLDYQPLVPPADDPTRLYRQLRWGRHVELFLLDTRQYRDANAAADSGARPKTLLGAAQLAWLERALRASTATWKILVASVPLSIPTGGQARDGFASGDTDGGFEREAARIFALLRAAGIRNHLWITTDVHFATGFRYRPFADDPHWTSHELVTGPLNAGLYPTTRLDPTFRPERLFLYGPAEPDAVGSFDVAVGWFNFGLVDVAVDGTLTAAVINGRGERVYELRLPPSRQG